MSVTGLDVQGLIYISLKTVGALNVSVSINQFFAEDHDFREVARCCRPPV